MREFKFRVDPAEGFDSHESRWDKEIHELQATGRTIRGKGPEGDEPVRIEGWDDGDPAGPYTEVYEVVPLEH